VSHPGFFACPNGIIHSIVRRSAWSWFAPLSPSREATLNDFDRWQMNSTSGQVCHQ